MQNYMKTILNGFKTWVSDVVKTSTADWNQSDKEAANYIKNRTHYDDIIKTDISGATYTISGITLSNLTVTHEPIPLELGQVWQMRQMHYSGSWTDAVEEEVKQDEYGTLYIGSLEGNYLTKTELTLMSGTVQQGFNTVEITCISGYATQREIKQLDEKYIPDSVARITDIDGVSKSVDGVSKSVDDLESVILANSIILSDYITGQKYKIQIENGTLVTKPTTGDLLIDFDYRTNSDGTYTLTGWKYTLDGVDSTELAIPGSKNIIL